MIRRRFLKASLSLAPLFGARSAGAADATYTLRMSVPTDVQSLYFITAGRFATELARRSGGRLTVEVYPTNQLANERASIDGLISGSVDLTIQGSAQLEPLLPEFAIFGLPFLFRNVDAAYRVFDGPVGKDYFAALEPKGIVGLIWGSSGFHEIETVSKPVTSLDDMKGLRFRIQGGAINTAMVQAMGAIPIVIDIAEVYPAIMQHTIDAIDPALEGFVATKQYQIVNHVAMSNHTISLAPLLASKKRLESLPPDLQALIKDEARRVTPFYRTTATQRANAAAATCKARGIAFTEIDYPAFRKAMDPLYASFQVKFGPDVLQRVIRATGS